MVVLLCAAFLEAGGDALMRLGLRSQTHTRAALFFVLGGVVLTFYGYAVNAPPWDFGASSASMWRSSSSSPN